MRGLVAILLMLASAPVLARPGAFPSFSPLSLADLYAKRMRFQRGTPRISVGIMSGQASIGLAGRAPLRLMFDEAGVPKTAYLPEGERWSFRVLSSRPAEVRYWVVVHSRRAVEAGHPREVLAEWKAKGLEVRAFEAGTIIAVRGSVLDTREWQVGVGGFATEAEAEALMAKLSGAAPEQLFVRDELVTPPDGEIGLFDAKGTLRHRAASSAYVGSFEGGLIEVDEVEFGRGYRWHGRERRAYRDDLYVVLDRAGSLALVNSVDAEKLLAGLVPAELFATAHIEALKAQAVTARGEIFSKLAHRHHDDPFHLCSDQHCQVYAGAKLETAATNRAVTETRGLLAFRPRAKKGAPLVLVDSRYSSSCGGHSEDNEVVWGTAPSDSLRARLDGSAGDPALAPFAGGFDEAKLRRFLESYPPAMCARASFTREDKFRWKQTLSSTQADARIASLDVGRLVDLEILGRGPGGRVTGVRVIGTTGRAEVLRELPVRRLFGNLNSGLFVVDIARGEGGRLERLSFTGGGWGHGVGMCQMGAIARAEHGQGFEQILGHYYNGAVVERIY